MRNIASVVGVVAVAAADFFVARSGDSRERSNRCWRRRRTYRRGIARWGPGVTPCSTAAGLLCAGAGIRRRARVPIRSRTLLGRLRLGIPPRRGLRLIVRCIDHRLLQKNVKSEQHWHGRSNDDVKIQLMVVRFRNLQIVKVQKNAGVRRLLSSDCSGSAAYRVQLDHSGATQPATGSKPDGDCLKHMTSKARLPVWVKSAALDVGR